MNDEDTTPENENTPISNKSPSMPANVDNSFPGQGPDYDSAEVAQFLTDIFNGADGICVWAGGKIPGYPAEHAAFEKSMSRSKKPKACYFGTATMEPTEDGLRNRQANMVALHCLVLDDIGTGDGSKCTADALPEKLRSSVSWIIETSPDNFQYGYLLAEPITDTWSAKQLVRIIYGAGPWDSGGAMPNKLVRLPCGVNLKDQHAINGQKFPVRLVANEMWFWTPQELLDTCGTDVQWVDIQAVNLEKIDPTRRRGAAAYREGVKYERQDGVIDDALEWLAREEWLLSEGNEWQQIRCPWHLDHTGGGDDTAGYSPLGAGGPTYAHSRGFHCFHSHCQERTIIDFLSWMATMGGPELGVIDPKPEFLARYIHNIQDGSVIDLKAVDLKDVRYSNFKDGHQDPLWVYKSNGSAAKTSMFHFWNTNPGRVKVWGSKYRPGLPRIIDEGDLYLNRWSVPYWPKKPIDDGLVREFIDFIDYLVVSPTEAEWMIKHMAMKVQNPLYRGPAVILSTPVQGTGRGRLEHFLAVLWGKWNVGRVRLPEFLKGVNASVFNDWLVSSWLFISESKDSMLSAGQSAKAYDTLKDYVEPGAVEMLVKNKYGSQGMQTCYSSVMISTNHLAGIIVPSGDRRFKRIENCTQPRDSEYFGALMARIDADPGSLWHYLLEMDLEGFDAYDNPNLVGNMLADAEATAELLGIGIDSAIDFCVAWSDEHCSGIMLPQDCVAALRKFALRFGFDKLRGDWEKVVYSSLMERTRVITKRNGNPYQANRGGVRLRPRHIMSEEGHITAKALRETHGVRLERFYNPKSLPGYLDSKLKEYGH